MNDTGAKQQIVEKIRDASNILVTVSQSPNVDELSAALGLTVMLNKMNKHATAVMSGDIPPAINFLDPAKTFENTVDSLRDFIIALDKEKADHLRYKVEGDVVKIFITPYRTTINQNDLQFSQGDYNVELVLALGVTSQEHLDRALEAHGRIFHDATVATISAGDKKSTLGSIDWNEPNASSLSEMLVSLSDGLKRDKTLLDEQIATAYLTGIVAATDRFSNNLTSSKAMTVAAQLMAAGANQQLIATKLAEANAVSRDESTAGSAETLQNRDGTTDLSEGKSSKVKKDGSSVPKQPSQLPTDEPVQPKKPDGELDISHEKRGTLDEVGAQTIAEQESEAAQRAEAELAAQTAPPAPLLPQPQTTEDNLEQQLASVAPVANTPSVADLQRDIAAADAEIAQAAGDTSSPQAAPQPISYQESPQDEPSFGGTLNATTEEAAEDKRREEESSRNHTILSHGSGSYVGNSMPLYNSPLNAAVDPSLQDQSPLVDPMSGANFAEPTTAPTFVSPTIQPPSQTLADIDRANRAPHEVAMDDIHAAYAAQESASPQGPIPAPAPLPPMPDFSTLPPLPPLPEVGPMQPPSMSSMPPTSTNPFMEPGTIIPPAEPGPSDPGQFQIPGGK